jgi:hypothetical protein
MVFSSGGVTFGRCFTNTGLFLRVIWKAVAVSSGRMEGRERREFVFMQIYCVKKLIKKDTSEA